MTCYHPLSAWQNEDGSVVFSEQSGNLRPLTLPCGQCIGCRLKRAASWAVRCMHESRMHSDNCFITLTYNDEHYAPSLCYRDFQLFMYRLRRVRQRAGLPPARFFMCGEYGDLLRRPHFHALLFGVGFRNEGFVGESIYRNSLLERLWPFGFSSIGDVTFESAGYVARYSCKKVTGPRAADHYRVVDVDSGEAIQLVPEFAHMSLKPGIGRTWFDKYWKDVYAARDGVVIRGKLVTPPRYYDLLLEAQAPDIASDKEFDRYLASERFKEDCTFERLQVRELVARENQKRLKRNMI